MRWWVALASSAIVALACVEPNDGDCVGYANALCAEYLRCRPDYLETTFGDVETCTARTELACRGKLDASGSGQTPTWVIACTAALARSCDELAAGPSACATPAGTRNIGESCAFTEQCGAGLECFVDQSGCGTCGGTNSASPNVGCALCRSGEACFVSSPVGPPAVFTACGPTLDEGMSCCPDCYYFPTGAPCGDGLVCSGAHGPSSMFPSGHCTPPVVAGGSCSGETYEVCDVDHGYRCDGSTCVQTTYASPGEPCNVSNETQLAGTGSPVACAGGECDEQTNFICTPWPADGEPCPSGRCMSPASCVKGTCTVVTSCP